jgi:hypothetical protein
LSPKCNQVIPDKELHLSS